MKIKKEVIIGIIVVIAGALLYFGLSFLKGNSIFQKGKNYYAVYNRVDGLVKGNPVIFNGYTIGKVKDIAISHNHNRQFIVQFNVSNTVLKINKDAAAKLASQGLMGSMAIEMVLGKSKDLAQDGDTLRSSVKKSLTQEVNSQLLPLKNKVEGLVSTIDSTVTVFAAIFNDDARGNISGSFEGIENAINTLGHTAKTLDILVQNQATNVGAITENVKHITTNINKNQDKFNNILNNFSKISDNMAKAQIAETMNNTKEALAQLTEVLNKVNEGQGTLGKLLKNDTLYYNLEAASKQLDLLLKDMRLDPKRYVHFSVFGKKNREYKGSGEVDYKDKPKKEEGVNKQ